MISIEREFHYIGEMKIKKSKMLGVNIKPNDDKTNWLFLKVGEKQYGFIYKIDVLKKVNYNIPFRVKMSFMLLNEVKKVLISNNKYEVLRGDEKIGDIRIISSLF